MIAMELFYRELGKGEPLLILHGLFGSSDNWLTQGKMLAEHYRVFTLDLRNHGQSPHHENHRYEDITGDIKKFIETHQLGPVVLVGHSMGGKAAMHFSLSFPDLVTALIVVDIAPKAYPIHHDHILKGLKSIVPATLPSRQDADSLLSPFIKDPEIRQFLLKNLKRKSDGTFDWKMNLDALANNIESISSGPVLNGHFTKPTLFIRGRRSNYIQDGDRETIKSYFPSSSLVTLDAGHWVQAEKPNEFVNTVLHFLAQGSGKP